MKYKHYTPREIAAFLEPHRAALVELIQRAAKITGCTCWQNFVYDLERGGIATRARLEQLYQYIVDAAVGIGRTMPQNGSYEKATAACLMHEAGAFASFLTAAEEDSRKTAAAMLNAAAARHAAAPAVANKRTPRRAAAPVVHACSAVIGKR